MQSKLIPFLIALGAIALAPGCATERSTNDAPEQTIPTLNLSDEIVVGVSGPFEDIAYHDSTNSEYGLQLPVDLVSQSTGNTDIKLEFWGPEPCRRASVYAYNMESHEWVAIQIQITGFPCLGIDGDSRLTLLPIADRVLATFVDPSGVLRLKGDLYAPRAHVIEVLPDYRPLLLSPAVLAQRIEWTSSGLVVLTKQRGTTDWMVDSLIWLDELGNRTYSRDLGFGSGGGIGLNGLAWSGDGLWVCQQTQGGYRYSLLDDSGQKTQSFFHYPKPNNHIVNSSQPMLWVNGEIWIPENRMRPPEFPEPPRGSPYFSIVDPVRSVDSGFSVVTRGIAIDEPTNPLGDIVFDGTYLCAMTIDGIVRFDLNGYIVDTLPLPVTRARATWDGEAFWMVHHGPSDAGTDHFLVSRFYPR